MRISVFDRVFPNLWNRKVDHNGDNDNHQLSTIRDENQVSENPQIKKDTQLGPNLSVIYQLSSPKSTFS